MRKLLSPIILCAALLGAGAAQAQFANHSLGLTLGYMSFNTENGIDHGIPIGLEASDFIEDGWEVVAHFDVMILTQAPINNQVLGIDPALGVHYQFMQEDLRPYIGADISYLHIFGDAAVSNYFGIGPSVGIDYFVGESISLGLRGQFNFYLALNEPTERSFGVALQAKTYF